MLAHNNATSKTLDPADLLVVDGTVMLTNGRWDGGELRARGPISATSGFDGGGATLRIDGSTDQLFTGTATATTGELPNLVIDKPSGTLTLAGTIRVLSGGWNYVAGALDPASSTVVFDSGSLLAGSHSLANVVLRGSGAKSIGAGETLTVTGALTLVDGTWDGGTLAAHGDLTQTATFDGGSGSLRIDGSADQLFTGSATAAAGALPALVIDKPSGTLTLAGTIRTARDWTYLGGALDAGTSSVVFAGAHTISGSHSLANVEFRGASVKTLAAGTTLVVTGLLTLTDGDLDGGTLAARGDIVATATFDGETATLRIDGSTDQLFTGTATATTGELPNLVIDKPSGTLTLAGTIRVLSGGWNYVAGALDPASSTVVFDSGSLLAGSHSLANVVLRGSGAKSIGAGETLTVTGALTLVDGTWDGGTLAAHGDLTQTATFDGGSGSLRIDGSADQLFTGSATAAAGALPALVIDKPSGTLTLAGTIRTAARLDLPRRRARRRDQHASCSAGAHTISGSHSLARRRVPWRQREDPGRRAPPWWSTGLLRLTDGDLDRRHPGRPRRHRRHLHLRRRRRPPCASTAAPTSSSPAPPRPPPASCPTWSSTSRPAR